MSNGELSAGEDTGRALIRATLDALKEHGYADLTIERIGAEFEKSPSVLYHHYDGKDDLLVSVLEHTLDRFEEGSPPKEFDDAAEHLQAIVDLALCDAGPFDDRDLAGALMELRTQAAHDSAYREHFTRHDRVMHQKLADIIENGIEDGSFRDVDPDRAAALLKTALTGARLQLVTTYDEGGVATETARQEIEALIDRELLPDADFAHD